MCELPLRGASRRPPGPAPAVHMTVETLVWCEAHAVPRGADLVFVKKKHLIQCVHIIIDILR